MSISVLFSARDALWETYREVLPAACARAGLNVALTRDPQATDARYIVYAPNDDLTDFGPYTQAKAVLSLWAGVEKIAPNPTLTQPLARMVDHGLTQGMVEWVTGHALRHHLGIDAQLAAQDGSWNPVVPPLAQGRPVTILGLGALGTACGKALAGLGFPVTGWSRSPKQIAGLRCLSGVPNLREALANAQILVLLLPLTEATEKILNVQTISYLPQGAVILNPGRGALIEDDALLDALDHGHIAHATLDTFRIEPLPPEHPFWNDPKITVTPHIASETRPASAARVIAENVRRGEAGEPLLHLVDRDAGY